MYIFFGSRYTSFTSNLYYKSLLFPTVDLVFLSYYFSPFLVGGISRRWLYRFFLKFSGMAENDIIFRRVIFILFFKIQFLSSISCPGTKRLWHRNLKNDKDLNIQTLLNDIPLVVNVFKLFCFVRRNRRHQA